MRYLDLTAYNILQFRSEYQLYCSYLSKPISLGAVISSPFRRDNSPSFSIFAGRNDGKLLWKDFGTGECGNIFDLVKKLYNCNFADALSRINNDFNLGLIDSNKRYNNDIKKIQIDDFKIPQEKSKKEISIQSRDWEYYDENYWNLKYSIPINILNDYGVIPCKKVIIYDVLGVAVCQLNNSSTQPIYAFNKEERYKIYRPNSQSKWSNTLNKNDIFSYYSYEYPNTLVIGKSHKDIICINYHLKFNAITFLSEQIIPDVVNLKDAISEDIENIIIYYDNDDSGKKGAEKLKIVLEELFPEKTINNITDNNLPNKDFSDLIYKQGLDKAKQFLFNLLC